MNISKKNADRNPIATKDEWIMIFTAVNSSLMNTSGGYVRLLLLYKAIVVTFDPLTWLILTGLETCWSLLVLNSIQLETP